MPLPPAQRLDLAAEPVSVGQARRFVTGVLADWGLPGLTETVALLTSELATNAVLHARTGYAVVVSCTADELRVDVLDGSAVTARVRQPSATAGTGRGVAMVASLARAWGETAPEELRGFAKGVYFTVPLTA